MLGNQTTAPPLRLLLVSNVLDDSTQVVHALHPQFSHVQLLLAGDELQLADSVALGEFDLALVDAGLSWVDSLTVVLAIKSRWPDCPIVLITTPDSETITHTAINIGLDGCVARAGRQLIGLPTAVRLAQQRAKERRISQDMHRQYRRLFDTVPVGLYRVSPTGQFLDANLTLVQMLGYPDRAALLAVNVADLYVDAPERAKWQAILTQPNPVNSFETQFCRRDGATVWVENNISLVQDALGCVLCFEGVLKDISQRKQARLAWQESEERFRTIIDQSPISIQVMTPDGWTIQVNRAWEKLWGVTAADVKNYNMLQDEQAVGLGMMPYVERGFAGETVLMPPVAYHTPESLIAGRLRWFQPRIYPVLGEAGDIRNVIMMYEDITERQWATEDLHRLSVELMNAQEAERKRISQELHDELGQALTAMRLNLDMLEKDLPPDFALTGRERLAEISMLADETLDHVRELSHTLRPTMLDELGLAPTLRWYVSRFAERLGIDMEFEVKGLENRPAPEIETTLYRIVQEALTNIARHSRASRVCLHLVGRETGVSALIEDDGLGFDVQATMAAATVRAGMGLFGMRERATLCGGTFTIQSQPGAGTRLLIELPFSASGGMGKL